MYTIYTLRLLQIYGVSYSTMMWHRARKTAAPPKISIYKFIHWRAKIRTFVQDIFVYYTYFLKDMAKFRFFVLLKGDLHCFRSIFIKESHRGAPCRTWRAILGPRRDGGWGCPLHEGHRGFYMAKWQASKPWNAKKCINLRENIGLWAKSAMGEFILELNDFEPYPKWLQQAITITEVTQNPKMNDSN